MRLRLLFVLLISIMNSLYGDAPTEEFILRAFANNIFPKWITAKVFLEVYTLNNEYLFYESPSFSSPVIRKYKLKYISLDKVNPDFTWSSAESIAILERYPFFVSYLPSVSPLPEIIKVPILEKEGDWVQVFLDWNCDSTAWLNIHSPVTSWDGTKRYNKFVYAEDYRQYQDGLKIYFLSSDQPQNLYKLHNDKIVKELSPPFYYKSSLNDPRSNFLCYPIEFFKPKGYSEWFLYINYNSSTNEMDTLRIRKNDHLKFIQWSARYSDSD